MPFVGGDVKAVFRGAQEGVSPDLDLHSHPRRRAPGPPLISELTWNTFRDHLILEYEIPKYDGDLGRPSVFVPLETEVAQQKASSHHGRFRIATLEALV